MVTITIPSEKEIETKLQSVEAPAVNELILLERKFPVISAELDTYDDEDEDGIRVLIEIHTEESEYDNESWAPFLNHENGFILKGDSFEDAIKRTPVWEGTMTEDDDWNAGILYIFEHDGITYSKIEFLEMLDDNKIKLRWSGLANPLWDEPYFTNVPFKCECIAIIK